MITANLVSVEVGVVSKNIGGWAVEVDSSTWAKHLCMRMIKKKHLEIFSISIVR